MRILENTHLGLVSGGLAAIPGGGDDYHDFFEGGGGGSINRNPLLEAGKSSGNNSVPEIVITASRPNNVADVMLTAGVGRAMAGAGAALGEGIAAGMGSGAWLGPAGAVVGAVVGAGIAYLALK